MTVDGAGIKELVTQLKLTAACQLIRNASGTSQGRIFNQFTDGLTRFFGSCVSVVTSCISAISLKLMMFILVAVT